MRRLFVVQRARRQGDLQPSSDDELGDVADYLQEVVPAYTNPLMPAEVGRANAMLEPLEKQAGVTVNHYHNDTIFARPGVDPTPRVAPGDIEN